MRKLCIIYLLLAAAISSKGQDIHFSQAFNHPLWQTPAAAGMMQADYRVSAIYKNQWSSVPVPFNTLLLSGDAVLLKLKNQDKISAGLLIYSDRAGDSKFSLYQSELAVSYAKSLGDSLHYLSGGFMFGLAGRSFSTKKLFFDNQFVDGSLDPSIPIDESFAGTSLSSLDIGAGLMYSFDYKGRARINAGIGAYHLNSPTVSFYDQDDVKLNNRYHFFISGDILVNASLRLKPTFIFQQQDVKKELLLAAVMAYKIESFTIPHLVAQAGLMYRNQDALVAYAGLEYNSMQFGLSYDINTSQLTSASRGNGGFELSAIYQFYKVQKINSKGAVCPIF
ncbi:MAG: PorP/SprF family type IX secretion system membrane protein [Chitinophagales bacterium]|nr:PorP/SprF family type IX secretion system membrane protein [Chitinophagales bacterium]